MIDDALHCVADYVNRFAITFNLPTFNHELGWSTDDGDNLIDALKRAFTFGEMIMQDLDLRARIDEGTFGQA